MICAKCKSKFKPHNKQQIYCSSKCNSAAFRERVRLTKEKKDIPDMMADKNAYDWLAQ